MRKKLKKDKLDLLFILFDTLRLILITGVIATLISVFGVRKMVVEGSSMYPTLQNEESVMINVFKSYTSRIDRFDVVVARNDVTKDLWVKRVIGLPGEVVEFKDDTLKIDGNVQEQSFLDEAYVRKTKEDSGLTHFTQDYGPRKLGEDEYLLVGDNRNESLDSRSEAVGPFKEEQIIANGIFILYPFSEMRYISNGR